MPLRATTAPDFQEQLNSPKAYAEGLAAARKLAPTHLAELCQVEKREAEASTRTMRENWARWWNEWMNEVFFEGKEEWQSQVWVPKPFTAVEQAGAIIGRSLIDSPDFFGVTGTKDDDKIIAAHLWKPLLKLVLSKAMYVPKFADVAKVGFVTGVAGYLKWRWQLNRVPQLAGAQIDPATGYMLPSFTYATRSMLAIDYVHPWRVFRDPDTQARMNHGGTYLWHSEFKDRTVLQQMAKAGWDKDAVERVLARPMGDTYGNAFTSATPSEREEAEKKGMSWERHKFRKSYLIDEGWGDILNENGDVVLPDGLMVHSQGEILYGPRDNPIWATDMNTGRRKRPFLAGAPISHPGRFEGRGILEQAEPMHLMFNNTLNLMADSMSWNVNPETEVYQPGLVNWDDTVSYPGKLWMKNIKERLLMAAERGTIKVPEVLAFLNYLDQQGQNSDFVTDFAIGLPGSRTNVTKGEVQIKTAQSLAIFDSMSKNLEQFGCEGVELTHDFILQYMGGSDFVDPTIQEILGPEVAQLLSSLPIEERVRHLAGNYGFTFTGVSQALQKADQLQHVMKFGEMAMSPAFAGRVDPTEVLTVVAQLMGIDDRITVHHPPPPPQPGPMGPGGPMGAPPGPAAGPGGPGGGPPVTPNPPQRMNAVLNTSAQGSSGPSPAVG